MSCLLEMAGIITDRAERARVPYQHCHGQTQSPPAEQRADLPAEGSASDVLVEKDLGPEDTGVEKIHHRTSHHAKCGAPLGCRRGSCRCFSGLVER